MKRCVFLVMMFLVSSVFAQTVASYKAELLALNDTALWQRAHQKKVGSCAIMDATGQNCPQCACNFYSKKCTNSSCSTADGVPAETGCLVIPGFTGPFGPYFNDGAGTSRCVGTTNCGPSSVEIANGASNIRWALNQSGDYCNLQTYLSSIFSTNKTLQNLVAENRIVFTDPKKSKCFVRGLVPSVPVLNGMAEPWVPKGERYCDSAVSMHKALGKNLIIVSQVEAQANIALGAITATQVAVAQSQVYFSNLNSQSLATMTSASTVQAGFALHYGVMNNVSSATLSNYQTAFSTASASATTVSMQPVSLGQAVATQINVTQLPSTIPGAGAGSSSGPTFNAGSGSSSSAPVFFSN